MNIPTRVSADPASSYWVPQVYKLDVYFNGQPLRWCMEADTEEGWVKVMRMVDNKFVHGEDGHNVMDTLYGTVEIRRHDSE